MITDQVFVLVLLIFYAPDGATEAATGRSPCDTYPIKLLRSVRDQLIESSHS